MYSISSENISANDRNICGNIRIFVDSQTALVSLRFYPSPSLLVRQCKQEVHRLGQRSRIILEWIIAYRDHFGNYQQDESAQISICSEYVQLVSIPLRSLNMIYQKYGSIPFQKQNINSSKQDRMNFSGKI